MKKYSKTQWTVFLIKYTGLIIGICLLLSSCSLLDGVQVGSEGLRGNPYSKIIGHNHHHYKK